MTIRDTAAWTIGRVLEICPEVVNKDGMLARLLPALSQALNQEPRVAANVCWVIPDVEYTLMHNMVLTVLFSGSRSACKSRLRYGLQPRDGQLWTTGNLRSFAVFRSNDQRANKNN